MKSYASSDAFAIATSTYMYTNTHTLSHNSNPSTNRNIEKIIHEEEEEEVVGTAMNLMHASASVREPVIALVPNGMQTPE